MGLSLPVPISAQLTTGLSFQATLSYAPAMIKGMTIDPQNPFHFDFIIDSGDSDLQGEALKAESQKLVKYFCSSLTVPEKDMWVNLSPFEKDRIIPELFSVTDMGRDLLQEDYVLKQLSASLMSPEKDLGKIFWERIRERAFEKFGKQDIPADAFNKIWIVPQEAIVYEKGNTAYIYKSKLKVMLGEPNTLTMEVFRQTLLPFIEQEVNEGKDFAQLRQIYSAVILAAWFKQTLKDNILNQVYSDQNKVIGIDSVSRDEKQKIYDQYLAAFKQGAFNLIKEEVDPVTEEIVPRKYFSGGVNLALGNTALGFSGQTFKIISSDREASSSVESEVKSRGPLFAVAVDLNHSVPSPSSSGVKTQLAVTTNAYNFIQMTKFPELLQFVQSTLDRNPYTVPAPSGNILSPKAMTPSEYAAMINKIVHNIQPPQGGVVYYPFGGLDPYAAFKIYEATDVVSVGFEKFGKPQSLYRTLASNDPAVKRGYDYIQYLNGYDPSGEYQSSMQMHDTLGLGWVALGRIMSMLQGQITGLYYFNIDDTGALKFLNGEQDLLKDEKQFRNAVVEFVDPQGKTRRFWYIAHNFYPESSNHIAGFKEFIRGLPFQALFLKASYYVLGDAVKPETKATLWDQVLDPARHNKAFIVSDTVGRSRRIWQKPNVLFLNTREQLGYATAAEPLNFGPADKMISRSRYFKTTAASSSIETPDDFERRIMAKLKVKRNIQTMGRLPGLEYMVEGSPEDILNIVYPEYQLLQDKFNQLGSQIRLAKKGDPILIAQQEAIKFLIIRSQKIFKELLMIGLRIYGVSRTDFEKSFVGGYKGVFDNLRRGQTELMSREYIESIYLHYVNNTTVEKSAVLSRIVISQAEQLALDASDSQTQRQAQDKFDKYQVALREKLQKGFQATAEISKFDRLQEAASKLGVSRTRLEGWVRLREDRDSDVPLDYIPLLAEVLGLTLNELWPVEDLSYVSFTYTIPVRVESDRLDPRLHIPTVGELQKYSKIQNNKLSYESIGQRVAYLDDVLAMDSESVRASYPQDTREQPTLEITDDPDRLLKELAYYAAVMQEQDLALQETMIQQLTEAIKGYLINSPGQTVNDIARQAGFVPSILRKFLSQKSDTRSNLADSTVSAMLSRVQSPAGLRIQYPNWQQHQKERLGIKEVTHHVKKLFGKVLYLTMASNRTYTEKIVQHLLEMSAGRQVINQLAQGKWEWVNTDAMRDIVQAAEREVQARIARGERLTPAVVYLTERDRIRKARQVNQLIGRIVDQLYQQVMSIEPGTENPVKQLNHTDQSKLSLYRNGQISEINQDNINAFLRVLTKGQINPQLDRKNHAEAREPVNLEYFLTQYPDIAARLQEVAQLSEDQKRFHREAADAAGRLLKTKKGTQSDKIIGRDLGISFGEVSKIRGGEQLFDLQLIPRLADYFSVPVSEIWGGPFVLYQFKSSQQATAAASSSVGGINLDPRQLNLIIKRDQRGMPLPVQEQPSSVLNIQGVVPVILNIKPLSTLFNK